MLVLLSVDLTWKLEGFFVRPKSTFQNSGATLVVGLSFNSHVTNTVL